MRVEAATISIQGWRSQGILLERYHYTPGTVEPLAKHCHEEYQFGLSFNCAGRYHYRRAFHDVPIGSLSIIHSGEVHAPSDRTYLPEPGTFWMMHLHPTWFETVAADMALLATYPFFPDVCRSDPHLNQLFVTFYTTASQPTSQLKRDTALWEFLTCLMVTHAETRPSPAPVGSARTAVKQACEYLHAHYAEEVSLDQLSGMVGLSRFHFSRVFQKEMGLYPSAYQTQLRIAHAKTLLAEGTAIATVASLTGFYDQSHLGKHFKRHVGVTPGHYRGKMARISYTG